MMETKRRFCRNFALLVGALAIGVLMGVVLLSSKAHAQRANCGPYEQVAIALTATYGEVQMGYGSNASGRWRIELWVNVESGTWTIIAIDSRGNACVASSGSGWEGHQSSPTVPGASTPRPPFVWMPEPFLWRDGNGRIGGNE